MASFNIQVLVAGELAMNRHQLAQHLNLHHSTVEMQLLALAVPVLAQLGNQRLYSVAAVEAAFAASPRKHRQISLTQITK